MKIFFLVNIHFLCFSLLLNTPIHKENIRGNNQDSRDFLQGFFVNVGVFDWNLDIECPSRSLEQYLNELEEGILNKKYYQILSCIYEILHLNKEDCPIPHILKLFNDLESSLKSGSAIINVILDYNLIKYIIEQYKLISNKTPYVIGNFLGSITRIVVYGRPGKPYLEMEKENNFLNN